MTDTKYELCCADDMREGADLRAGWAPGEAQGGNEQAGGWAHLHWICRSGRQPKNQHKKTRPHCVMPLLATECSISVAGLVKELESSGVELQWHCGSVVLDYQYC
jgi:hypothetical protein